MRGFVLDMLGLFFIIVLLVISIGVSLMVLNAMVTASAGMPGSSYVNDLLSAYRELDWVVPFTFGIGAVVSVTYAYLSPQKAPLIVLYAIMAIIVGIVYTNMNPINTIMMSSMYATFVADFPLTALVINNLPALLSVVLVIIGVVAHSSVGNR